MLGGLRAGTFTFSGLDLRPAMVIHLHQFLIGWLIIRFVVFFVLDTGAHSFRGIQGLPDSRSLIDR